MRESALSIGSYCLDRIGLNVTNPSGAAILACQLLSILPRPVDVRAPFVNLSKANLRDANLVRTNLSGANLTGTNLIGARLVGANLSDADLTSAILNGLPCSTEPSSIMPASNCGPTQLGQPL